MTDKIAEVALKTLFSVLEKISVTKYRKTYQMRYFAAVPLKFLLEKTIKKDTELY